MNPLTGQPFSARYGVLKEQRDALPVSGYKDAFFKIIETNDITVIMGETGSGKTTQIPAMLLEYNRLYSSGGNPASYGKTPSTASMVGCTQPRRVAAMSVAKRVAEELDVKLGAHVGYSIRFEDCSNDSTVLLYMTDGMLLREAMGDPLLSRYRALVIDEAHERTVSTDLLLGLLKRLVPKRKELGMPLKLVIMSATLDAEKFQAYFDDAPLLSIPGRTFSVDIMYTAAPEADYFEAALRTAIQIHLYEDAGDILVFLTGEEEIENACRRIMEDPIITSNANRKSAGLVALPLYSSLPMQQQSRIFEPAPAGARKVVFSTNIAETSLTIDGVVYVIDTGFSKQKLYNPRSCVESLLVSPISQAAANQRAGRAGRTKPGKCFRLFTESSFQKDLLKDSYPEILRCNLSALVLQLKRLGVDDLVHFDFIDPPTPEALMRALETLHYLGALGDEGELAPVGHLMSEFPVDPLLAKILISSSSGAGSHAGTLGCSNEILSIVSMLSVPNPFLRPKDKRKWADIAHEKFKHSEGDFIILLNVYHAFKALDKKAQASWCKEHFLNARHLQSADHVRSQLERLLTKHKLPLVSPPVFGNRDYYERILRAFLSGFFMQVAHLENNGFYATLKDNQMVKLHPSCCLDTKPDWVLYAEFVLTSHQFIRTVSRIKIDWLFEVAPHFFGNVSEFPDCQGTKALQNFLMKKNAADERKKKRKNIESS